MKIEQTRWSQTQGGDPGHPGTLGNEAQHSLTFAGDLPLMQANLDRLIDGAVGAAFLQTFKKYMENPVTMLV